MNSEEIKQEHSMLSIVEGYGLHPNRAGFIHCPFHTGDRGASMKIYKDSYHCFGCGANGDVFSFVEAMEHCSFKEAFYKLGGEYPKPQAREKPKVSDRLRKLRFKQDKETRERQQIRLQTRINHASNLVDVFRQGYKRAEPLSDAWAENYNEFQKALYKFEYLREKKAR